MTTDIIRFKDFTPNAEDPPTFQVYGVRYVCLPDIPLDALAEMSTISDADATSKERVEKMVEFIASIMEDESGDLFRVNVQRGSKTPVGVKTIQQLVPWLLEVYGLRPTQESSESSDGSTDDDGNLTGGA
jgi:hypothetical protein